MPATYEPIATTTLGSAAASITFSSIASSWTDIKVIIVATAASNANFAFRFNSDSGSNYSRTRLAADGSSVTSSQNTNQTELQLTSSFSIGTTPVMRTLDIFSYAGSTNKTVLFEEINDLNGSGGLNKQVGLWRNTAAITSISFFAQSATNFAAGTTATLYGIKNA
jgi:hypothetical protein